MGIPKGICRCSVCGVKKDNSEYTFYRTRIDKDGERMRVNTNCKECQKKLSREVREARKKAPPKPDWGELCPICKNPVYQLKDGFKNSWQCDHEHGTTNFRGWICKQCNTSLGGVGDSSRRVVELLYYLKKQPALDQFINEVKEEIINVYGNK